MGIGFNIQYLMIRLNIQPHGHQTVSLIHQVSTEILILATVCLTIQLRLLLELYLMQKDPQSIGKIFKNYQIGWILKFENSKLQKTNRINHDTT